MNPINPTTDQQLKEIKQSFRQMMDGATSQSMREKGLDYHLNWGATLSRLREKADEIGKNYELSIALWKENVRECKILATMIMPPDVVLPEVVDLWMEQIPTIEIAEQAAFNLFQYLPFAADKAFQWIAMTDEIPQICGYHVFSRLYMKGQAPNERGINEFVDQALSALHSPNVTLRKAAFQSLQHLAELGLMYERLVQSALRRCGLVL
jgi:hypothetical protein